MPERQGSGTDAPSVSVVLTFYNSASYVETALRQVAALDGGPFELLITDDGSTDGTADLIREHLPLVGRARLLLAPHNRGIAAIRNWAVQEASGDFVWFVDNDDVWSPRMLDVFRSLLASSDSDVAVVGAERVSHSGASRGRTLDSAAPGTYAGEELVRLLLTGGVRGYLWNKAIRRQLLLDHPFPPRATVEDFAVVTELVFAGAVFSFADDMLYRYVERPGSLTNSRISGFDDLEAARDLVVERIAEIPALAERLSGELTFFDQWFFRSSAVNSGTRLGSSNPATAQYVRQLRRSISFRTIRTTAAFSRREALIALLMKTLGPAYRFVYRAYLAASR